MFLVSQPDTYSIDSGDKKWVENYLLCHAELWIFVCLNQGPCSEIESMGAGIQALNIKLIFSL